MATETFLRIGEVSASNSLVGSSANDQVGSGGITKLGTSTYFIRSPLWDNGSATDAGAVSPGNSFFIKIGPVSASNSLVGSSTDDQVGSGGVTAVGTGIYLVRSPSWDDGAAVNAGAVSPGNMNSMAVGVVSAANSIVGTSVNDQVGSGGITALGTTAYLVRSPLWDNGGAANAGAVTPGSSNWLLVGNVSAANSIVGSSANDQVGSTAITTIGSGGFILRASQWDNQGLVDAGAVTAGFIDFFRPGALSSANAVVGASANDQVGSGGITTVGTDFFIVRSPLWDNGSSTDAGAATPSSMTFFQGKTVSAANSLVGSSPNDQVSSGGVTVVGASSYLVHSPLWDHSVAADAGAVSFGNTPFPVFGRVSLSNSLVGSHPDDQIGSGAVTVQGSTGFTISSPHWCYGAGATTIGNTSTGVFGVVSASNSTVGAESAVPEIALLQPGPTEVASNGARDFGGVTVGGTQGLTFAVKNTGADDLRLTGAPRVSITGTDAALFSIAVQPPAWIVTGDSATFTVNFTPANEGAKTAQLSIANNDSNENPYRVTLSGTGLSQMAGWRQTHFGSSANGGDGADDADFDHDGIPNLVEYALGLHPAQSTSAQLPQPVRSGGNFTLSVTEPNSVAGIVYGAEWSTSLAGGSWLPVSDTGTPPQHVFSVPIGGNTKVFMRLKVTPAPAP